MSVKLIKQSVELTGEFRISFDTPVDRETTTTIKQAIERAVTIKAPTQFIWTSDGKSCRRLIVRIKWQGLDIEKAEKLIQAAVKTGSIGDCKQIFY